MSTLLLEERRPASAVRPQGRRGLDERRPRAAILRLDNVVVRTRSLYIAAWSAALDAVLKGIESGDIPQQWVRTRPETFDSESGFSATTPADYDTHLFDRPRLVAARNFLSSRGLSLPSEPYPEGPELDHTIADILARMDEAVTQLLAASGTSHLLEPELLPLLHGLHEEGLKLAVTTPSHHAWNVAMGSTELLEVVDVVIPPHPAAENLGTPPEEHLGLRAAREALGVDPDRAVVFESTPSGISAARIEGFAEWVGVGDTDDRRKLLRESGAHEVRARAGEVTVEEVVRWIEGNRNDSPHRTTMH